MIKNYQDLIELCEKEKPEQIDLKFIDLLGKIYHTTIPSPRLSESIFLDGVELDTGSAIGIYQLNKAKVSLIPDICTSIIDPPGDNEAKTISILCNICDSATKEPISCDTRNIANRAEKYLESTGIALKSIWKYNIQYYIFDSINVKEDVNTGYYMIDSGEADWNSQMEGMNLGYKVQRQGGGYASPPQDSLSRIRSELTKQLDRIGMEIFAHHHSGGGPGHVEMITMPMPIMSAADKLIISKYIIKWMAWNYGKFASFMPKPLFNEAGSGLFVNQCLVSKDGNSIFYDRDGYEGLSKTALYYIGGLLIHGPSLAAITNPSNNSYTRLVPGFPVPTKLYFSKTSYQAAVLIDDKNKISLKGIQNRVPDCSGNIYLSLAAQLMAGLDGIKNKIDPIELGWGLFNMETPDIAVDKLKNIRSIPTSLLEACHELEKDHGYLLEGDVFNSELIHAWIDYKITREYYAVKNRPHPYDFKLYIDI